MRRLVAWIRRTLFRQQPESIVEYARRKWGHTK